MELFLFNKETYEVEIAPEVTLMKPFKKIIARDRSQSKNKAKAELAYIWFMCDYKSDYQTTVDEELRSEEIIDVLDALPKGYKPDKMVKDACDYYKTQSETIASKALDKQRVNINTLIDKIGTFMQDDDVSIVEKATKLSSGVPGLLETIDKLEKVVRGQQEADGKTHRGNQDKAMMEDGI